MVLLGLGDYWIRFQDRGIRILCWLAVLAAFGWTCRRFLLLPLRARLGNVDLAVRRGAALPRPGRPPGQRRRVSAQAENDPLAGSAALRRAVIAQTAAATERLDFTAALDRGPPYRAALLALAVALVAAVLAALNPPAVAHRPAAAAESAGQRHLAASHGPVAPGGRVAACPLVSAGLHRLARRDRR